MKMKFLLSTVLLSTSFVSMAQDANKAYAITGKGDGDFLWVNIRQIDLATGDLSRNVYEKGVTPFQFNTSDSKKISQFNDGSVGDLSSPTNTMVAAAAYDKRHEKLFFTPMRIGELRWLDLSSSQSNPKFYTLQGQLLNPANLSDEANHITRMTIGADGNGYAITNDGNHVYQFTTGKKTVITDLGNLIDASANGAVSVHNRCSSWGGDMVADAYGKLYLFTASHNVFTIDLETRIATYIGAIKNISGTFTVNGAAVDNDGNVIVSSANSMEGFYKVDIKELNAVKINTTGKVYNASDLANSNLLFENNIKNTMGAAELKRAEVIGNDYISIYPNPVSGSEFKVTFDKKAAGEYNIVLTDLQGRLITTKQVFVKSVNQVESMQLKIKPAAGMYLVKVSDASKKTIFSDKIVIE